jgi:NitT/TauT family transport system substrate-binding protein
MNRRSVLRSSAFAVTAIAGAGITNRRPVSAQVLPTIRIGLVTADTYAEAYYGDEAGIFRANGIAVDIKPLANSAAIAAAMVGGTLDVGVGSPSQVGAARENGLPFEFFAPGALFASEAPTTVLMVAKASPINRAADLAGKTIAVENLKSLPQLSVAAWMQRSGVDPASVKYVEIPTFSMAGALEAGRVDAAVIGEPGVAAAKPTCRQIASPLEAIARRFYISAWFSTKAWLDANPQVARKFVTAIGQTATWANAHQKETGVVLARVSKMTPETIATMVRARYGEKMDPLLMQPLLDLALKNGLLPAPITAHDLIAPGY